MKSERVYFEEYRTYRVIDTTRTEMSEPVLWILSGGHFRHFSKLPSSMRIRIRFKQPSTKKDSEYIQKPFCVHTTFLRPISDSPFLVISTLMKRWYPKEINYTVV